MRFALVFLLMSPIAWADPMAEKTIALFDQEKEVTKVFFEKGQSVEWKLAVNASSADLKTKSWNGYASAMCNYLYETGYINRSKTHIVRIVDAKTLMDNGGNWRGASVGSCNCKSWEPFDQ